MAKLKIVKRIVSKTASQIWDLLVKPECLIWVTTEGISHSLIYSERPLNESSQRSQANTSLGKLTMEKNREKCCRAVCSHNIMVIAPRGSLIPPHLAWDLATECSLRAIKCELSEFVSRWRVLGFRRCHWLHAGVDVTGLRPGHCVTPARKWSTNWQYRNLRAAFATTLHVTFNSPITIVFLVRIYSLAFSQSP